MRVAGGGTHLFHKEVKAADVWESLLESVGFDVGGGTDREIKSHEKPNPPRVGGCKCCVAGGLITLNVDFHLRFDVPALDCESIGTALQNVVEKFGFLSREFRAIFRETDGRNSSFADGRALGFPICFDLCAVAGALEGFQSVQRD